MRVLITMLAGLLAASPCGAQNLKPAVAPPSSWVTPMTFDKRSLLDSVDSSTDARWLLRERQINAQIDESFVHDTYQVLTPRGAQNNSRLFIDFDPGCQSVTVHWVRILRGAAWLNRLDVSAVQTGPATPDAAAFLFSSPKSAVLPLADVRPGDILDYAYTIEGANPAMGGKFAARIPLQFQEPVSRLVTKLFWPPPRRLYVQNHNTGAQPVMSHKGNLVVFTWDLSGIPGLRFEPGTPAWYDPYPWVEASEFQKWQDVTRWMLGLFQASNAPSTELTRKIADWKSLPSLEDQTLAALRYVQEEVRSSPRESGNFGYEPAPPSAVLARGFGDGADKARLLVAFLRGLKLEAWPALVNTRFRQSITDWHPSPKLFDHVLVEANLGGAVYWLDPAAQYQEGSLATRCWPDCGCGLVGRPGNDALTSVPSPPAPKTTVTEIFRIGGLGEESTVRVLTVAEGADADDLRRRLATTSRADLEREHLALFARSYPEIESRAPLAFRDDAQQDRVEMTESYLIPTLWNRLPDELYYHCQLCGAAMAQELEKPDTPFRTMPLAIPYPKHRILRLEANIPALFGTNPGTQTVESPAFLFRRTISIAGPKLILDYDYHTLAYSLAPDAIPAYLHQLDAATDLLSYTAMSY